MSKMVSVFFLTLLMCARTQAALECETLEVTPVTRSLEQTIKKDPFTFWSSLHRRYMAAGSVHFSVPEFKSIGTEIRQRLVAELDFLERVGPLKNVWRSYFERLLEQLTAIEADDYPYDEFIYFCDRYLQFVEHWRRLINYDWRFSKEVGSDLERAIEYIFRPSQMVKEHLQLSPEQFLIPSFKQLGYGIFGYTRAVPLAFVGIGGSKAFFDHDVGHASLAKIADELFLRQVKAQGRLFQAIEREAQLSLAVDGLLRKEGHKAGSEFRFAVEKIMFVLTHEENRRLSAASPADCDRVAAAAFFFKDTGASPDKIKPTMETFKEAGRWLSLQILRHRFEDSSYSSN